MPKKPLKVEMFSADVLRRGSAAVARGSAAVLRRGPAATAAPARAGKAKAKPKAKGGAVGIGEMPSSFTLPDTGNQLVAAAKAATQSSAFGSGTDVGITRDHNEDSLFVAPPLFVVADGMGGHAAGEVASELAIQTVMQLAPGYPNAPMLEKALIEANHAVYETARVNPRRNGMGTTVTAALLQGTRLVIAQVGDSRAYLLHRGHLQQLTKDHSFMQDLIDAGEITPAQARIHPQRNYITRALGTGPTVPVDTYDLNVSIGDRLMLCTDGLSGMVDDADLAETLSTVRNPQTCVNTLIRQANEAGGHDNITVIVVDVAGGEDAAAAAAKRHSRNMALIIGTMALLLIIAAVVLMSVLSGS